MDPRAGGMRTDGPRPARSKGDVMRLREPLMSCGALGLAVLAVSAFAVWTSVNHVRTIDANTVRINVQVRDPGPPRPNIPDRGVVTGIAVPCAGPVAASRESVKILAIRNGRTFARQVTQAQGRHDRYRFLLPPGRYAISAPVSADKPRVVVVHSGQTVTVNFLNYCY